MQKLLLFSLLLLSSLTGQAQITWDGGGGTSDWGTAANWNPDGVPGVGDKILLNSNVTITGISSSFNPPAQISVAGGATVTFDMALLVVGDGNTAEHSIVVNANSSVVFASGSVALAPPTTQQAITIESSANNASVQVNSGVGLIIQQADRGINIANSTASFSNAGTIEITALNENGIDNNGVFENSGTINISGSSNRGIFNRTGSFENNGSITITDINSIGIRDQTGAFINNDEITITGTTNNGIVTNGNFTNASGGSITVEEVSTDGVAISSGVLTNDGDMSIIVPSASSGGNDGISIAPSATLDNNGGTVTVDGLGASARLTRVEGTLSNSGTMTLSGGSVNGRMLVSGNVTNELGGELDMGDGRIDLNDGSLTNDGLIRSSHTLAGVFLNTGSPVATNNGFFDYTNGNLFTRGSVGSSTDNGIDLNDPAETTIDADGSCTVNIANADGYDYFDGSTLVGTSGPMGQTTLSNLSSTTMVTLTNGLTGVEIIVEDVCAAALPITLTSFTAKPNGKDVLIEWETATELNNDYMAVERSADGRRFEEIGRVQGAGNSNTPIRYALTDDQPLPGLSYYRLRQVDFDGTTSYSDVRSVNLQSAAGGSIRVYPTVSNGKTPLTLTLPSVGQRGDVALDIFHASGALVHSVRLPLGRQQQLQLPTLSPGTYIIKSRDERLKMAGRFVVLR